MYASLPDIFVVNSKIYKINEHNFLKKDQMMISTSKWTLAAPATFYYQTSYPYFFRDQKQLPTIIDKEHSSQEFENSCKVLRVAKIRLYFWIIVVGVTLK